MSCIEDNCTYSLRNVQGGTCMDLSGGDSRSVIGYGCHRGPNQLWLFQKTDGDQTFHIKSAENDKFLAAEGEPRDGQKIITTECPYAWRAEDEQGVDCGVRLLPANNTNFCIDLSDHGNARPGTPIQLWTRWAPGPNQVWKLHKVE